MPELDTVKRLSQRINRVITYAVNNDLIEYNPTGKIEAVFKVAHKQNMPSLPPSELLRVMKAISLASIVLQTRCLIEWKQLTITRPIEAVSTLWSSIDLKNELWTIPGENENEKRAY